MNLTFTQTVLNDLTNPPSKQSCYCPSIKGAITRFDKVHVSATDRRYPSFVGIVRDVKFNHHIPAGRGGQHRKLDGINIHPAVYPVNDVFQELICVQYLMNCNTIDDVDNCQGYELRNDALQKASEEIEEVALTNGHMWVTPAQIGGIAYIIHQHDVLCQRYGPINFRDSHYIIRYSVNTSENSENFIFTPITNEFYQTLNDSMSITSIRLDTIAMVSKGGNSVTSKAGDGDKKFVENHTSTLMTWKTIINIIKQSPYADSFDIFSKRVKRKMQMQHTDLSLQSTSEGTTIHHIKVGADSICDFRKLFGDDIGVAFKSKKFPKVSSKEVKYLQEGDKVNIIEYSDRVGGNDNYLELTFDEINNCLKHLTFDFLEK